MKVCPNCSAEFEDQLSFCRQDGTALQQKQVGRACPSCGKEVASSSKFCRHCGLSTESPKVAKADENLKAAPEPSRATKEGPAAQRAPIELAENHLREEKYREAISVLDPIVKTNPADREARLLHLFATVKLYNVYGYETHIEALRSLSDLTEKEREIVREVFLIRSDEAQKRGKTDESREYQRLATRVVLGQPLIEPAPERPVQTPRPRTPEATRPRMSAQVERQPQSSTRPTSRKADASPSYVRTDARTRKRSSRLFISFVLVFGLAGVLAAGMLVHYAKKQGVDVTALFQSKPPPAKQSETKTGMPEISPVGQVLAAEELGFKVWGIGATDANRKESVISERIGSQLSILRQLYQQEVQNKPGLMGSLVLQLTINPTGRVTKVEEYAGRIRDDEFKKMIVNEVSKWQFPESSAGLTKINYPLLFVPPSMDVATLLREEQDAGPGRPVLPEFKNGTKVTINPKKNEPPETTDFPFPKPKTDAIVRPPPPRPLVPPGPDKDKPFIGIYEILYPTSVYQEPRDDSPLVARVEAGTRINIVGVRGNWLEVRSRHGNPPGFIKRDSAAPIGNR